MDELINLLEEFEGESSLSVNKRIGDFFSLFFEGYTFESTRAKWLLSTKKSKLSYLIRMLLENELYHDLVIDEIKKRLSFTRPLNSYDQIIICSLVNSDNNSTISILKEILNSDSFILKEYIFYHNSIYPIKKIFQTTECRSEFIKFINSEYFETAYKERVSLPGYHSESFAFPSQYQNCFKIKEFDHIKNENLSASRLSKLASNERLESIRVITNDFFKLKLIKDYYNSVPTLYKNRFVRLVDKKFPELNLKKNGDSLYKYQL